MMNQSQKILLRNKISRMLLNLLLFKALKNKNLKRINNKLKRKNSLSLRTK